MKISSPDDRDEHLEALRSDLEDLLAQPTSQQVRPCAGCDMRCGCPAASTECCCECAATCKNAAMKISSDGNRYPIEQRVLPLVYGLASMRVITPCWSCQGHPATCDDGSVKAPQVWFYSRSIALVHLIGQFLSDAWTAKQLRHEWQVRTSPYSERNVPIFIIEPHMSVDEITERDCLNDLQHDLHFLGTDFEHRIRAFAKRELDRLPPAPPGDPA